MTEQRQGVQRRYVAAAAAALVLLLLGGAGGMVLARTIDDQNGTPGTGSVDVGFAQDMSVHHLQAVTMAGWARDHSTDPEITNLAFDIESTQDRQVGMMTGWLNLWEQPSLPTGRYMTWMPDSAMSGHAMTSDAEPGVTQMPGMATSQEIAKLRSLSGRALDVYFLQLMFRHHEGGASMARYAAQHAGVGPVRALANSIAKSQAAEMQAIRTMLTQRDAAPLP